MSSSKPSGSDDEFLCNKLVILQMLIVSLMDKTKTTHYSLNEIKNVLLTRRVFRTGKTPLLKNLKILKNFLNL